MIHDQIDEYLGLVARDNAYRVVRVLKESAYERTEVVAFAGVGGVEQGPFVRKRIAHDSGMGSAYQELFAAQRQGRRFRHLPRIFDCYDLGGYLVVVMEYVEGATLHEVVYDRDPSPELAAEVFPLLCDAVLELHEGMGRPIIHRDLKPSNAILSEANLTLVDFGIARAWRDGADADTSAFGTRAYAPPEQFGYGQTDVRSDVYALGMMLYYLLTEQVPRPGLAGGPVQEEGIPQALRPVLAKATAFDPAARYASVRELRGAFEEAAAPHGPGSLPEPQGAPVRPGAASPAEPCPAAPGGATAAPPRADAPAGRPGPVASGVLAPAAGQRARGAWPPALQRLWRASEWAGIAWDALVALFAFGIAAICCADIANPAPEAAHQPLWLRAWQYCGVGLLLVGLAGLLVDWRWLRAHVRALAGLRWGRWLAAAAIVAAAGFSIALSGSVVAAAFFPRP